MMNTQHNERAHDDAELLCTTERQRLRALVEADISVATALHADDSELVTPAGHTRSKEQLLGEIASGKVKFLVWEPASMAVRIDGELAILRYPAQFEIELHGQKVPLRHVWSLVAYEKRAGRWQVVWSLATEIKP
jgi:hypothetical protein